jgi:hypothetical protein
MNCSDGGCVTAAVMFGVLGIDDGMAAGAARSPGKSGWPQSGK